MAESSAFAFVCEKLEAESSLDRLESRGTVRLALKQAGLEAGSVTPDQMRVVLERVLPGELEARGVSESAAVCSRIAAGVRGLAPESGAQTPEAVFERLGGRQ